MSVVEGIAGFIASVFAIIGAMVFMLRWLARRFDQWATVIVDNSSAMRNLTYRVARLEQTLHFPPEKG